VELMNMLVENTNIYACLKVLEKPTYGNADGSWTDVTVPELYRFIGLLIYMGFVQVPTLSRYWSTTPLHAGLWARHFMTRNRFKSLLAMLHVTNPGVDEPADRLAKIRPLLIHIKRRCMELYQAKVDVSVDERMVKSKGRSGIRQFIANKPVRFGFKGWVLAESDTGYTMNFSVYTGRRETPSQHGLGHDVVVILCEALADQGYRIYFDNFYTSPQLLQTLISMGLLSCGTCRDNRIGLPAMVKERSWARSAERGDMRYVRVGNTLCLQWKDTKVQQVSSMLLFVILLC
jgi:hypothetical protein